MLSPATLSRSSSRSPAIPTGLGFSPRAYSHSLRLSKPSLWSTGLSGLGGLGTASNQQIASLLASSGAAGIAVAVGAGLMTTGVGALAGAAIMAGAAIYTAISSLFSGCGQTCTQATTIANQVAGLLQTNLNNYMSQPIHYASVQAYYLGVFDQTWAQLQQACGNPQLGAAGQRCITDRQAGACTWKASPGGWAQNSTGTWTYTGYGASGSGSACWNWFIGYRDPIANDPTVVPDPVTNTVTNSDGSTTTTTVSINPTTGVPTSTTSTAPATVTSQLSSLTSSIPTPLLLGAGVLVVLMLTGALD